jgi:hypothetical protein
VLGIGPDATDSEIRAAYRARARALHPDHRRRADPDADTQMAAVNRAWATLRDPSARAAYDRSIGVGVPPPLASEEGPRRAPSDPPPVHDSPPGCLMPLAGVGPWVVVLALLAAIFVFTAYAGSNGGGATDTADNAGDQPLTRVRDLRGSCIGLANGAVIVVDCFTVPNEGVIVAQASVGAACPDGTTEWLIRQQEVLACTQPGTEARTP